MKFILANIKMTLRNKQVLFWSLFFPIFMMLLFGAMFQGGQNAKYDVGLVNKSDSKVATTLTESLKKIDALTITEESEEKEKEALKNGDRVAVIIIPANLKDKPKQVHALAPNLKVKIEPVNIDMLYNANKGQDADVVGSILNQFITKFNQKLAGAPDVLAMKKEPFESRDLGYIDFLLPGLIALSLMMGGVVGIANGVTTLREKKVLKRLLATPVNPSLLFTSQVITRLILALVQAAIMVAIGVWGFGAVFIGNVFIFTIVLIFGAVVFLVFGLVASSLAKSVDTVEPMTRAITLPMMFLGDVFFPIKLMPSWLQPISRALPLTYMSDALRKVITEGASLYTIRIDLIVLFAWGVVGFFVAYKTFKWE